MRRPGRGFGGPAPGKVVIPFARATPRDRGSILVASAGGDPCGCRVWGVRIVSFLSARCGASVPPATLFYNSEYVTGPHGPPWRRRLRARLRSTRLRADGVHHPLGGGGRRQEGPLEEAQEGDGSRRMGNQTLASTVGSRSKPLKVQQPGGSESDCGGRARQPTPGGEDDVGDDGILADREDLEGQDEPHECSSGKPEGGWRAEKTVEVVKTARTERSDPGTVAVRVGASRG